ncbi:MAG TPA: hypothetical protein VFI72_01840, partial [Candidatus Angelobacter sp.]|nr:hypothetical protein [Candidatus Angelobacter sp.]
GPLGEVVDVIFDHDTMEIGYVVINGSTGQTMLPASHVFIDPAPEGSFVTDINNEQIPDLPRYDEKALKSDDDWKRYEEEYQKGWHAAPVQHRHGSDRNITPDEIPAERGSTNKTTASRITAADLFPERLSDKFSDPTPGAHKITLRPHPVARVEEAAAGLNMLRPRWENLEGFLLRNRDSIAQKCDQCRERTPEGVRGAA